MTQQERLKNLSRILAGYTPVVYRGVIYKIYDYTFDQEFEANAYYEFVYNEYLENGDVFTDEERMKTLAERGIWSPKKDKELEQLYKDQEVIKKEIANSEFKSANRARYNAMLKKNIEKVEEMEEAKSTLYANTLEYMCRIAKYQQILFANTHLNGKRLWNTWDEFQKTDMNFIMFLLNKSYLRNIFTESVIRDLARNEPWRGLWKASQKSDCLFGKPVVQYTISQRDLTYWSIIYDNIYDSPECPPDSIIHNDALLDAWFVEQSKKRQAKSSANIGNSRIANAQDVGIFVDSPEDAEKVYNLNDPAAKNKIMQKERYIAQKGRVKEEHLPESQLTLRMMMNKAAGKQG